MEKKEEKVKIKMAKTTLGADEWADGRTKGVKEYEKDKEYEVGPVLAKCFNDLKVLAPLDKKEKEKDEDDKKESKKENGGKTAPENKGGKPAETK